MSDHEVIERARKQLTTGNNQIAFATGLELVEIAKRGADAQATINKIAADRDYYVDQLVDLGYLRYG